MTKKISGLVILLFVVLSAKPMWSWAEERYSDLQNFSKILNLVQQYYVEPVDTKKLVNGAIKEIGRAHV